MEVFLQLVLSNCVAVPTAFLKRCYCTDMLYCGNALAAAAAATLLQGNKQSFCSQREDGSDKMERFENVNTLYQEIRWHGQL